MSGGLEPLPGGMSGETFLSDAGGEPVVVRIYAGRSVARGRDAPQVDAAVLGWVAGLVPVPRVLEVRPGDPEADVPGLLVTELLPGRLLSDVLPALDEESLVRVGHALGTLLGRLAHVALPHPGLFVGRELRLDPLPEAWRDLPALVTDASQRLAAHGWSAADLDGLDALAVDAQAQLDTVGRSCLVHSDLNPKNVLVDPDSLEVTGLLDWEFAHSGSPYSDLGNLLRHEPSGRDAAGSTYLEAVLAAREAFVPDPRPDALELARCADLVGLVDLAGREDQDNPPSVKAAALLRAQVAAGDVGAGR
ncbi:phosphotransferase family protein [Marmoricola endophyticus]|uniref:phosphotransferase family protein n=1 Tax=Marmoricola endophyticus TaxID=2040280 RepID=UPI00227B277B|nr:phosphotransferase [Marmoricola endophyticus]